MKSAVVSRDAAPSPPPVRLHPLLRGLSSIWFGMTILALILVYSSIFSAVPAVCRTLELTEMQAFRHWLFVTLVVLFVLSLLSATFLRTRWTRLTAGTVLAHIGLLLLTGGALAYFGTKIEGNVLLWAPAIEVRARVENRSVVVAELRAAPGETWTGPIPHSGSAKLNFALLRVERTQAGDFQPAAADVSVRIADAAPRLVHLTAAPDDWQPVHETLDIRLATNAAETLFYDNETPALYFRDPAIGRELVRRIDHLPIHREHYLPAGDVLRDARGTAIPSRRDRPEINLLGLRIPTGWFEPWRMPIDVDSAGLPFTVRITGYVPYVVGLYPVGAGDGQERLEPVLEVRERRQSDAARARSAIRLQLTGRGPQGGWSATRWCLFSPYPRVEAHPVTIQVPGSDHPWELVYSRAEHDLGAAVAADKIGVTYFPGQHDIESFRSDIVVQRGDQRPQSGVVSTNRTLPIGRWTLFQSGFDFEQHWRYTILGVGNRVGMWPMNIGWIITTLGCLYAFYVKPVLLRRAKERM
jgi:hypothetical protein